MDQREIYDQLVGRYANQASTFHPLQLYSLPPMEHSCQLGHGYTVVYDGGNARVHACGFDTREEMERERADCLKQVGWTPPRWWQWWRWNDTRLK